MSSALTFITNEPGKSLRDRFGILLEDDTRYFDCLVGYFFISGFYRLHPALEKVEKIRILVGLQTDRTAYELLQKAKEQGELTLKSHASAKERVSKDVLSELEKSADSAEIETGVHKFVEWIRSGNLAPLSSADDAISVDHNARNKAASLLPQIALKAS